MNDSEKDEPATLSSPGSTNDPTQDWGTCFACGKPRTGSSNGPLCNCINGKPWQPERAAPTEPRNCSICDPNDPKPCPDDFARGQSLIPDPPEHCAGCEADRLLGYPGAHAVHHSCVTPEECRALGEIAQLKEELELREAQISGAAIRIRDLEALVTLLQQKMED